MMRGWLAIGALALVAGCNEHRGWTPSYQFASTPYGDYLAHREVTLLTGRDPVQGVPVARPIISPTAADIVGVYPVPIPPTQRIRRVVVPAEGRPPFIPAHPRPAEPIAVVPVR